MNLSDSKKKLALAGVLCGLVAACLAYFGNLTRRLILKSLRRTKERRQLLPRRALNLKL